MNICVAIVASRQKPYDLFKYNWDQITKEYHSKQNYQLEFYFIYGNGNCYEEIQNTNEYICDIPDSIDTMLDKTHRFMTWALKNCQFDFLLRTNLSTLFDFDMMIKWIQNSKIPRYKFIGGSWIGGGYMISGTNMLLSKDTVEFLSNTDLNKFPRTDLEDVELCKMARKFTTTTINIKRLDFITMNNIQTVLYHKCSSSDRDIFCFRFKTNNRYYDVVLMNLLYTYLQLQFSVDTFIQTRLVDFEITSEFTDIGENFSNEAVNTIKF